ncbi:acyl-ACP-UDP-N- acetylglucosamine O-acyltransferase [Alcanivorax nanhaiticus]|uniref:Acyl-ACP-UDP-N-acetylglucosamine O-acyltransferase n=1 Tax=Alcanivorax nanhaiticus TaxID=1177154 RepID=A0A095SG04_9GAMM|nr:acetyltransferase [Alcanivorax nanhaiticus]KGD63477.1 acyl-ACP-UDP-N- acetylglucosamine O-acyltransferase [Alcanivorax nanhaiticus]
MSRRLGIIGAGGHGKVVADTAERAGWSEVLFFDSRFVEGEVRHAHWPIIAAPEESHRHDCDGYFVAIGHGPARQLWCEWLLDRGLPLVSLVDPAATVSQYTVFEPGVLVVAGAVVNVDCTLERGVIVNTLAGIDHDCTVGAYSHICPGSALAGSVSVGEHCWVGIGSQVKQGIHIGRGVTVGAGATVVSDVPDGLTVLGTPARSK